MRNKKFRQAIIIAGEFRYWHYWGLIDGAFIGPSIGLCSPTEAIKNSQQYIGLQDKNSIEIYEGDIVTILSNASPKTVKWEQSYCGFNIRPNRRNAKGYEIIGNVCELPNISYHRSS